MLSSAAEKPYRFPRPLVSGTNSKIGWRPATRPPDRGKVEKSFEIGHAAAKSRHPIRRAHCRAGARHAVRQPRRAFSRRRENLDGATLGVAAMDLLRARLQRAPTRRLGPLLYRAVLSRRADRARGRAKRLHRRNIDALPDGAFVALGEEAFAVRGDRILRWTPQGYDAGNPRPRGGTVDVLTPPAILAVLAAGYEPL